MDICMHTAHKPGNMAILVLWLWPDLGSLQLIHVLNKFDLRFPISKLRLNGIECHLLFRA